MDLEKSMMIAASGMRAQRMRLRVIAENLANANSTADTPGGDPYRRKVLTFQNVLDRQLGARVVKPGKTGLDPSKFPLKYDPGHPAAGGDGYVKLPNVNGLIEMMDMREAQRSYEANLRVITTARTMLTRTAQLLRR